MILVTLIPIAFISSVLGQHTADWRAPIISQNGQFVELLSLQYMFEQQHAVLLNILNRMSSKRRHIDTARRWTFIYNKKCFRRDGIFYGTRFNAKVGGRPLEIGVYRRMDKRGLFKPKFLFRIKGRKIKKGYNLVSMEIILTHSKIFCPHSCHSIDVNFVHADQVGSQEN